MTSAPMSPSTCVQNGPATFCVRSATTMPSSGSATPRVYHRGQCPIGAATAVEFQSLTVHERTPTLYKCPDFRNPTSGISVASGSRAQRRRTSRQEDEMTARKIWIVLAGALWLCLLGVIASVAVERLSGDHQPTALHLDESAVLQDE